MNKKQLWIVVVALVVLGASVASLNYLRTHQSLGKPGVKTRPIPGSSNLQVVLPEHVLDYASEELPIDEITTNVLPRDTSFGRRRYDAPDGFGMQMSVVLMGSDRTSLHKPQFCLTGQGWVIDPIASRMETIRIGGVSPYDLPVLKLVASKPNTSAQGGTVRGLYVYWFVADKKLAAGDFGVSRMLSLAWNMVCTGKLERWAYVSCFAVCLPGQEDATYERMSKFIAASVPEYQVPPK